MMATVKLEVADHASGLVIGGGQVVAGHLVDRVDAQIVRDHAVTSLVVGVNSWLVSIGLMSPTACPSGSSTIA